MLLIRGLRSSMELSRKKVVTDISPKSVGDLELRCIGCTIAEIGMSSGLKLKTTLSTSKRLRVMTEKMVMGRNEFLLPPQEPVRLKGRSKSISPSANRDIGGPKTSTMGIKTPGASEATWPQVAP